jgi:adenosylcobinamide kinase/adenosylcobinamide-phosphate guanylyltransferase
MNREKFISRQIILVTGAARSGKSEWAEALVTAREKPGIYIATAQADSTDPEWQARIEQHRLRRPSSWQTLEVSEQLVATIETARPPSCLLIDSLGTWVANFLHQDNNSWEKKTTQLLKSLQESTVDVILVAEETGWGVVPAYSTGRQFRAR